MTTAAGAFAPIVVMGLPHSVRRMLNQDAIDLLQIDPSQKRYGWLGNNSKKIMSPNAKVLYLYLRSEANVHSATKVKWPGNPGVAGLLGMNKCTVSRSLLELRNLGAIQVDTSRMAAGTVIVLCEPSDKLIGLEYSEKQGEEPVATPAVPLQPMASTTAAPEVDERDIACRSHAVMARYLLYGRPSFHEPDNGKLTPTRLNWMTVEGWSPQSPHPEKWSMHQLMGYYWFLVSWYREGHQLPQTLPDWGRMGKAFKNANKSPTQIYQLITHVITYWDAIKELARRGRIPDLQLNEFTLFHSIVNDKLMALCQMPQGEIEELAAAWQEHSRGHHG